MTLPVSSYEELLVRVRSLTHETIQLRRELSSSLSGSEAEPSSLPGYATHPQRTADLRRLTSPDSARDRIEDNEGALKTGDIRPSRPTTLFPKSKENEAEEEVKDVDERSSPGTGQENGLQRGEWGPESLGLWHSGPSSLGFAHAPNNNQQDSSSVISFSSSVCSGGAGGPQGPRRAYSHQQLGAKVEMVYNLLSMLGTSDREDMSKTLLAMSSTAESCQAMRQSGCLPLLIQLIHAGDVEAAVRTRAAEALANIVQAQTDEKRRRRESRVLKLLQTVREHCDSLKSDREKVQPSMHPGAAVAALMKFSFDAEHRQAMCTLGGLHAIAELIQLEHEAHGRDTNDSHCVTLRRYAGMALTNLTFGDGANKALLCSFTSFMEALVAQLTSPSEDLRQVTASVVRNLSWRADAPSKTCLREVGAVTALMTAAMDAQKEATLKSILSALWNLSAHCSMNKVDICSVSGALAFLVKTLRYKASSSTLGIIENAGGILRNVSSHIAVRDDYRQILRDAGCFEVLLEQLKSPSLTVVSNACGTLWNLSARCAEDQRRLWDMGATSMLRSLVQSKHKMIAMGSSAALKNLLAANPTGNMMAHVDTTARSLGLQPLPSLFVRKQRALEQELDATLAETCENIELEEKGRSGVVPKRSDSKESVTSTQSDSVYERVARGSKVLDNKDATLHGSLSETGNSSRRLEEAKLLRRYRTSGIPTPASRRPETAPPATSTPLKNTPPRRGIPILKNRFRPRAVSAGPSQRFQSTDFPSELDEETNECPVNYSLQDPEAEGSHKPCAPSHEATPPQPLTATPAAASSVPPALYAETDLDQPTDFSLKYGEETSSDEDIAVQRYGAGFYDSNKNDTEDTTHTYYTEGTPYDGTPYNFSGATSMSDLRIDPSESEGKAVSDEKIKEVQPPIGVSTPRSKTIPRTFQPEVASAPETRIASLGASGASSPRCVGSKMPRHSLSKVRDFESGVSTPERPIQYCEEGTPGDCISRVSSLSSLSGKESSKASPGKKEKDASKVVTFTVTETPLMFSRSSSLTSLNSLAPPLPDQDGASSVVSTFSRITSGAISPSELPDSPTQTVPPSPAPNRSVFDELCEPYKEEGTPIEFSCRSSLSSLSFERTGSSVDAGKGDQTVPEQTDRVELTSVSEGDEDADDDILADCISIGMQDTRNRPRMPTKSVGKVRTCLPGKPRTVYEDSIQTYHTEDTPANISHAGSHSDLSILTVPGQNDEGSANSSDAESILNECIHSGMPQAKPSKIGSAKKIVAPGSMGAIATKMPTAAPLLKVQNDPIQRKELLAARDEVATFATENSPCTFSTRSSLSDLTINTESSAPSPLRPGLTLSPAIHSVSHGASPGSISLAESEEGAKPLEDTKRQLLNPESEWSRPNTRDASFASVDEEGGDCQAPSATDDLVTALSRSLSVDSFESCGEPTPLEQALLEQCIHSGMPHRTKNGGDASAARTVTDMAGDAAAGAAVERPPDAINKEDKTIHSDMTGSHTWSDDNKKAAEVMVASGVGNHTWSDDVSLSMSPVSSNSFDVGLQVVDGPKPVFRVGAGVMSSPLAVDASLVSREIRKLQEEQMFKVGSQSSLTSEFSLMSCDSFLDAELSGLELPDKPTPDFLTSEDHPVTLKLLKLKNEPLSIPSLGRLDSRADYDLENSMISVASLTSEVADSPTLADDSDTEVPEDDMSIMSNDNLPLDSSSPKKPQRKLTPKEKRQQIGDRYRTYTVEEMKAMCDEEKTNDSVPAAPLKTTPKQRRLNDRDRFLTRTISLEEETSELPPVTNKFGTYRVHKEKPKALCGINNLQMELTAAERLELLANASLVAQCLTADDISINTDTYVALPATNGETPICRENGETEHAVEKQISCAESDEEDLSGEPRGPRITVPSDEPAKDEGEPVRAIRGRRKPLYSSPGLKKAVKSSPPSPKTSNATSSQRIPSANGTTRILSRVPQLTPLVREGTFTKEDVVGAPNTKVSRLPEQKSLRSHPKPPSASNGVPSTASAGKSRISPPAPQSAVSSQKRHSSAGATSQYSSQLALNANKRHSTSIIPAPSTALKTSSSNHSMGVYAKGGKGASGASPAASPENTRPGNGKSKTPKKEATSKIASLWKKVEETKRREKLANTGGKDTRVWITNPPTASEDEVLVIEQEEVVELNSGKIVRSSTFQGDARPKPEQKIKTVRNSGDFSTWEASGKTVVSAIVAPYNYSPPSAKPPASLKPNSDSPAMPTFPSKVTTV